MSNITYNAEITTGVFNPISSFIKSKKREKEQRDEINLIRHISGLRGNYDSNFLSPEALQETRVALYKIKSEYRMQASKAQADAVNYALQLQDLQQKYDLMLDCKNNKADF